MDQLEQNQAALRADMENMGARVNQLLETLHAVVQGQDELRQSVARLAETTPQGNPAPNPTVVTPNMVVDDHEDVIDLGDHHGVLMNDAAETIKMYHALEERLKAMECSKASGFNAAAMCLVPRVVIPPKFKVPDFDKYKGTTCPKTHLRSYCRKMAAYTDNEPLLMHFFQDSLTGASLEWYMQLERTHVSTWGELADAFLKHYHYNTAMAPSRAQLQNMTQKSDESFKEYAQRWRELAARVQPPLLDRELVDLFMGTLQGPYLTHVLGSTSTSFSDMEIVGERVETCIKAGKIQSASSSSNNSDNNKKPYSGFVKKKEGESSNVTVNKGKNPTCPPVQLPYYPTPMAIPNMYAPQAYTAAAIP